MVRNGLTEKKEFEMSSERYMKICRENIPENRNYNTPNKIIHWMCSMNNKEVSRMNRVRRYPMGRTCSYKGSF